MRGRGELRPETPEHNEGCLMPVKLFEHLRPTLAGLHIVGGVGWVCALLNESIFLSRIDQKRKQEAGLLV